MPFQKGGPKDPAKQRAKGLKSIQERHTLYDAAAGRIIAFSRATERRWITKEGTYTRLDTTRGPEEVLYSARDAPERYQENDTYFANDLLPDGGRDILPDSDLLKAIHEYTSLFYESLKVSETRAQAWTTIGSAKRTTSSIGGEEDKQASVDAAVVEDALLRHSDERSMDATALLAFGILLEEAAKEALGRDGELVFTEAEEIKPIGKKSQEQAAPRKRHTASSGVGDDRDDGEEDEGNGDGSLPTRTKKRQKTEAG